MTTTIIFDLDGTLLNTLDDLWASVNYSLAQNGYPTRSRAEVRQFLGNGARVLIEKSMPTGSSPEAIDTVFNTFRPYYQTHAMVKTRPYDGIVELLKALKWRGIKTAIVSNKPDGAVQELYERLFKDLVDMALGECPELRRKPSPDMVLKAMELLNSSKAETIYVGDSEVDYATAKNCGIRCVSVSWGFRDRSFLEAIGADTIIDEAKELLEMT